MQTLMREAMRPEPPPLSMDARSKGTSERIESHSSSTYRVPHDAWSVASWQHSAATAGSRSATSCGSSLTMCLNPRVLHA